MISIVVIEISRYKSDQSNTPAESKLKIVSSLSVSIFLQDGQKQICF